MVLFQRFRYPHILVTRPSCKKWAYDEDLLYAHRRYTNSPVRACLEDAQQGHSGKSPLVDIYQTAT